MSAESPVIPLRKGTQGVGISCSPVVGTCLFLNGTRIFKAYAEDAEGALRSTEANPYWEIFDFYFCAGAAGFGAGVAVCDFVCEVLMPESTEFDPVLRDAMMESVIEVTMKMMADQVVARESAVAAPRGPNAVWLPMPPKAAAMSPLLPLCKSTTMIKKKQTTT